MFMKVVKNVSLSLSLSLSLLISFYSSLETSAYLPYNLLVLPITMMTVSKLQYNNNTNDNGNNNDHDDDDDYSGIDNSVLINDIERCSN